ncbi:Phophatidylserine decarboxylase-domain-containing protein [Pisolithus orientalis]|uniref:Phophatidylserine decarboxylase-domain-containing protein n=1 Tax=Pisolithus orientalis TaxID=936130 RepID=UPI0022252700|nr:Phophatidylserine decarboxylase-domain-containing protein [Pisolithus orientalis]KAI5995791.1 Phophatidylserine decarboxylase-domain-containing protein [Pisolithus orientalis]
MPQTTVCRWLPKDRAVVDRFVDEYYGRSCLVHGRSPKTGKRVAEVGEKLESAIRKSGVSVNPRTLRCHYRVRDGEKEFVCTVRELDTIVQEFKDYIEKERVVYDAFNAMFEQAPPPADGTGNAKINNYEDLMEMFDTILTTAPSHGGDSASDMAASVPFYAVISRFCNTPAGYIAFTHPGVNKKFYRLFMKWNEFLASPASKRVLHSGDGGWLSTAALNEIVEYAGGDPAQQTFDSIYICDTSDPHYGYKSYDDFFVRELKAAHRAVVFPEDPAIVNSACSSTINHIHSNLKRIDRFWLKNTPYSLNHMLAEDELVDHFVGGTLIQAMLASLDYHRWRSPVNGTVVKTRLIAGMNHGNQPPPTYFAARWDDEEDPDVVTRSQDFVTAISTRALIFIQAEEPVGLMCFVGVGLCEVSSCDITVKEGQVLKKGDQLGMFHFGGSTHCLIFGGGVTVTPIMQPGKDDDGNDIEIPLKESKVRVGKDILTVAKRV